MCCSTTFAFTYTLPLVLWREMLSGGFLGAVCKQGCPPGSLSALYHRVILWNRKLGFPTSSLFARQYVHTLTQLTFKITWRCLEIVEIMHWNFSFLPRDQFSLILKILILLRGKHFIKQSDTISCHNFQYNKSFFRNKVNTNATSVFSCTLHSWIPICLFVITDELILGPGSRPIFLSFRTNCWWRKMCTRLLWFGNRGPNWRTKSSNKEVQWLAGLEAHASPCAYWRNFCWFFICILYKTVKRALITESTEQATRTTYYRFRVT